MGQKVNPISVRLGYIRGWESMWYSDKHYAEKLFEDHTIRKYIHKRIQKAGIAKIVIERTLKRITITIHTSRPGIIIGKSGSEVDKLKDELKKLTDTDVNVRIHEVKKPELDARLVADNIAQQLQARMSFRKALKSSIQNSMRAGAEGIKVKCSGRLGGAEMARSEGYKEGRTPLHTFRADIDYALGEAQTIYGKIGIKVWIFKGEVFGKRDISLNFEYENKNSKERGDGGDGFRRREGNRGRGGNSGGGGGNNSRNGNNNNRRPRN